MAWAVGCGSCNFCGFLNLPYDVFALGCVGSAPGCCLQVVHAPTSMRCLLEVKATVEATGGAVVSRSKRATPR